MRAISSVWPTGASRVANGSPTSFRSRISRCIPICAVRKTYIDDAGDMPNLTRWMTAISARPAVAKGMRAAGGSIRISVRAPKGRLSGAPKENGRREIRHRPPHCALSAQSYFR